MASKCESECRERLERQLKLSEEVNDGQNIGRIGHLTAHFKSNMVGLMDDRELVTLTRPNKTHAL